MCVGASSLPQSKRMPHWTGKFYLVPLYLVGIIIRYLYVNVLD